jgi:hypothetical protein
VIARNEDHGHPAVGDLEQQIDSSRDQARCNLAAKEEVSPMHDEIDQAPTGRFEAELEIPKEILPTPPTLDAGPQWKIVPEMGVGHEENANSLCILFVAVIRHG